MRRCDRSRNRQIRDKGTGMRLTNGTKKLIPETRLGIYLKERSVIRNEDDFGGRLGTLYIVCQNAQGLTSYNLAKT